MDSVNLHMEVAEFISLKGNNDGSHDLKVCTMAPGAPHVKADSYMSIKQVRPTSGTAHYLCYNKCYCKYMMKEKVCRYVCHKGTSVLGDW
jgi:hypothetical protein